MNREAVALAQELSHPSSLAVALDYAAMLQQFRWELPAVYGQAEATIALCTEQGFAYYLAWGTTMQGWAAVGTGPGPGRYEPQSPVAAAGQVEPKPVTCSHPSTVGSPRALTPPTCRRPGRCWRS